LVPEKWSELGNRLVNQVNQITERWQKRFTLRRSALLKRYIEGELGLHIHFRTTFPDGVPSDYCAVFERANEARVADVELENVCVLYGSVYVTEALLMAPTARFSTWCLSRISSW
jgi:hypothetical protein